MPTSPLRQQQLLRDFNRVGNGPNSDFLRDYGYDRATGIYGAYADPNGDTTLQPGDPTPAVQPLPLPSATPTPTPAPTARPLPTVAPRLPVSQGGGSMAFLPLLPRTPVRSGLLSSTYSPEELAAYNAAHAHLLEGTVPTGRVMVNGRPVPTAGSASTTLRPGATLADPTGGGRYGSAGQNYGMTSQQANALLAWSQANGGAPNNMRGVSDEGHTEFGPGQHKRMLDPEGGGFLILPQMVGQNFRPGPSMAAEAKRLGHPRGLLNYPTG